MKIKLQKIEAGAIVDIAEHNIDPRALGGAWPDVVTSQGSTYIFEYSDSSEAFYTLSIAFNLDILQVVSKNWTQPP